MIQGCTVVSVWVWPDAVCKSLEQKPAVVLHSIKNVQSPLG